MDALEQAAADAALHYNIRRPDPHDRLTDVRLGYPNTTDTISIKKRRNRVMYGFS